MNSGLNWINLSFITVLSSCFEYRGLMIVSKYFVGGGLWRLLNINLFITSARPRGGATLCTRHVYTKYVIDNRMFTIQFENGLWSEKKHLVKNILKLNMNLSSCLNLFSIWDLLKYMIAIQKVYKYCYSLLPKVELYWLWLFFCSVMEF